MNNSDAYFKKTVPVNYKGHRLQFRVSQSLFSSNRVDLGTQRLLRTLTSQKLHTSTKILDFGCGYGPLGIILKSLYHPRVVHMVDRDALALDYSSQNAQLNNVSNIKIYGSLGYDDITETDFDLITSNIPAKVGKPVLSHILQDAQFYLSPFGRVAIVVIDSIGQQVTDILADQSIKILFRHSWPGHLVFHYEFSPCTPIRPGLRIRAFNNGIYHRGRKFISIKNTNVPIETTYGLPEFDTLSYQTKLLLDNLPILRDRYINRAIVFNPGQGFVPVALSRSTKVREIVLIDRDLQALRVSSRNLALNGYPTYNISLLHQVDIHQSDLHRSDCIVGILNEKDSPVAHAMLVKQAAVQLSPNGLILFASSSTVITRIETLIHSARILTTIEKRRLKGKSILILRRRP